ncbi:MAG: tyrosine-type recombinase/integrase [Alphaproteobacteria bacterium]|nr:tyrosine-type recombinase/integrase [Alphaproteobacteria bacterium SS10]
MGKIGIKYVSFEPDRHGNDRYYFRKRGQNRIRLPAPGDPDFAREYQRCLDGQGGREQGVVKGSLGWLIREYYQSAAWAALGDATKKQRTRFYNEIPGKENPIKLLKPRHIRRWRDERSATPSMGNAMLKALSVLFDWACEQDYLEHNPAKSVKRFSAKTDGFHSWTPAERAQFERHWPSGSRERLAYALLYYLAARRGDVVRMGRQHVKNGRIDYKQHKTKQRVSVPIHPALQHELDQVPADRLTFLVTQSGKAFSDAGFGNYFRAVCDAAGLNHCSAHGLRKSMSDTIAEAGGTDHEVMSVTGHQTIAEVQRYTKAARRDRIANSAMDKIKKVSHLSEKVRHAAGKD